jgi:hypothetical protein
LVGNKQLLSTIPSEIQRLTLLQHLTLSANQFSSSVPNLSSLIRLTHLALDANQLVGTLRHLPASLQRLYIQANHFKRLETLPPQLTVLYAQQNLLEGTLPPLPSGLTTLALESNALRGALLNTGSLSLKLCSLYDPKIEFNCFSGGCVKPCNCDEPSQCPNVDSTVSLAVLCFYCCQMQSHGLGYDNHN